MVDRLKFRDVILFKLALKQYCIQNGFDYKYIKNDKVRVTIRYQVPPVHSEYMLHSPI